MRIAQVAPLYESVPPQGYGGTERVVSYLTEELAARGHEVTLFASGDSTTSARLVAVVPTSLRLNEESLDHLAHHVVLLERVRASARRFDVLHFHIDYLHFPLSRQVGWPHVTTLHGRLDIPDLQSLYTEFPDLPLVSISNAQRGPLPEVNWLRTIHHGLPEERYEPELDPGEYLAFIGRISPEKRVDRAIEIAERSNRLLKIAAKVDSADQAYFEEEIEGRLSHPNVEFLGEIGDGQKNRFLGEAYALLFPIAWPEPFGLVMIEAMACGTPVVAFREGSVPEVIDEGVTGFLVDGVDEAVEAVGRVESLSRATCRSVFEERFSARRMGADYVDLYERIREERT